MTLYLDFKKPLAIIDRTISKFRGGVRRNANQAIPLLGERFPIC